jgi:hypothetical protein
VRLEAMSSQPSLADALRELWSQVSVLAVSGLAGAAFRAILAPERKWKRRIVQGAGGAISAVFLGGILGHMLDNLTGAGFYAYSAAGFIMGSGGEGAVKALQDRFLGAGK